MQRQNTHSRGLSYHLQGQAKMTVTDCGSLNNKPTLQGHSFLASPGGIPVSASSRGPRFGWRGTGIPLKRKNTHTTDVSLDLAESKQCT